MKDVTVAKLVLFADLGDIVIGGNVMVNVI